MGGLLNSDNSVRVHYLGIQVYTDIYWYISSTMDYPRVLHTKGPPLLGFTVVKARIKYPF